MSIDVFLTQVLRCNDLSQLWKLLTSAMASIDYDRAIFSLITPHRSIGESARHGILSGYRPDWQAHYDSMKYERHDPVRNQMPIPSEAFTWKSVTEKSRLHFKALQCMLEAEMAGMYNGIGIPLFLRDGSVAGIGAARPEGSRPPTAEEMGRATAFGRIFYDRFIYLKETQRATGIFTAPLIEI